MLEGKVINFEDIYCIRGPLVKLQKVSHRVGLCNQLGIFMLKDKKLQRIGQPTLNAFATTSNIEKETWVAFYI